jgi:hypothetical protein
MKRHIKTLTVLVIMIAIAPLMLAAIASADGQAGGTIEGEYAVTGSNACLLAPFGFNANLIAINGVSATSAQTWEGVYTFTRNGDGEVDVLVHAIGTPAAPGSGGSLSVHWEFQYTVNEGGRITFTLVPGTYIGKWLTGPLAGAVFYEKFGSIDGVISPNGKQMIVTWGAPVILYAIDANGNLLGPQLLCNGSFVLLRLTPAQ